MDELFIFDKLVVPVLLVRETVDILEEMPDVDNWL